jgi:hypothetical protein
MFPVKGDERVFWRRALARTEADGWKPLLPSGATTPNISCLFPAGVDTILTLLLGGRIEDFAGDPPSASLMGVMLPLKGDIGAIDGKVFIRRSSFVADKTTLFSNLLLAASTRFAETDSTSPSC